jgi:hypothetical protein
MSVPKPDGGRRPGTGRVRPNGRVAWGLLLIGLGRPAGFAQFGASSEAFLASLAPLLAFLIVMSCVVGWPNHPLRGVEYFLTVLCTLLAPAVIADLFCRLWNRRQNWALYANVLNCGLWLMMAVLVVMLPLASLTVTFGLSPNDAAILLLVAFTIYLLWFHWFTARHALNLSRGRALLVMFAVVFGTALILHIPAYVGGRPTLLRIDMPVPAQPGQPAPTATRAT